GAHRRCRAAADRAAPEAAADPEVDRVHGHPLVRHGHAALRRAAAREPGKPRARARHVVFEPARLPARVPLRRLQRRRCDRSRPPSDRSRRRGADRHAHRPLQDGGLMRIPALGLRIALLTAFAVFFAAPIIWLLLAPTKTDAALVTSSPLSFGSLHQVALAWKHLNAFSDHIYRRWIENSLFYALSATGITLVAGVPAGYGL